MSRVERNSYPTEAAIDRLITDKEAERRDQAKRLGQLVWRNIDLANLHPHLWQGSRRDAVGWPGDEDVSSGTEYKLANRIGACLIFAVLAEHEDLLGTPDWLLLTRRVDLQINTYDVDLPDDVENDSSTPDQSAESIIHISLADDSHYAANTETRRQEPYVAHRKGDALDILDTETVIGILTLLADRTENL